METCKYCTREIVEKTPNPAGTGKCGGMGCSHMQVYGLHDDNCRQVVVRSDIGQELIVNNT